MIDFLALLNHLHTSDISPQTLDRHKDTLAVIADNSPRLPDVVGSSGDRFGIMFKEGNRLLHFSFSTLSGDATFEGSTEPASDDQLTGRLTEGTAIGCLRWVFASLLANAEKCRETARQIAKMAQTNGHSSLETQDRNMTEH